MESIKHFVILFQAVLSNVWVLAVVGIGLFLMMVKLRISIFHLLIIAVFLYVIPIAVVSLYCTVSGKDFRVVRIHSTEMKSHEPATSDKTQ